MTKKQVGGKKLPQRFLQQKIYKFLKAKPKKGYGARDLSRKLGVKNSKDSIQSALDKLHEKGSLMLDGVGKYKYNPSAKTQRRSSNTKAYEGKVDLIASGAAFIAVSELDKDVYIPEKYLNGALHQDRVKVEVRPARPGRRPEGKVIEVVERSRTSFLGIYRDYGKYGLVYIDDHKVELEIKVLPKDALDAQDQEAVIVHVYDFGNARQMLMGRVTAKVDMSNRNNYEMNSILIGNGFDLNFPPEVIAEAEAYVDEITPAEMERRRDLRDLDVMTIDPVNAKDFDDAISLERLDNGNMRIGVHIADVTHFVKEGSVLDKEAYKRSTSVYLVDRVCPMLPEHLSNGLCSLRPHEDRYAFSALFEMDDSLKVVDEWFGKAIIHSKRRFTYEEAQEVIESGAGDFADELTILNKIAKKLKKQRYKKGSIDFESDEVRFELDEEGKPIGLKKKVRVDSHKLVEEYMLLANRRVARYVAKKAKPRIPYVYRVHDLPDPERLTELALLAGEFGIKMNVDTPANIADSLNKLASPDVSEDLRAVLRPMAIRCMAKAVYGTDNIGHYGLGFDYYTHFTSPIRRYSDVLVHRLLEKNLEAEYRVKESDLEEQCLHISAQERNAVAAERESIKYKQVEYLSGQVGETFEGVVRSIVDKGMFIELVKNQADGLLRFDKMGESFHLHEARIKATGALSGDVYRIGDRIMVTLLAADLDKRQIEFGLSLLDEE